MIQRLLDGAEKVIAHAPHCWLMTISPSSGIDARPMGHVIAAASHTDWRLYFLADSRSNKVRDIHSTSQVRLSFETGDEAFVSVAGAAAIITDTAIIARRWLPSYDRVFQTATDKANAVFIDINAEELRLWIRGLTPEPFGAHPLKLRRLPDGDWQLDSERT